MSRTLNRTQIIEIIGRRLGLERARGGRGRRRRLAGDTGSRILNAVHATGEHLPSHALASTTARSAEEFAQRLRRNILIGRFLHSAERALEHRALQPLTDQEREALIRIGDDAFQGGFDGKSAAQAVSDALNNEGFPTPLGDQSSDDFDAGRQPLYDASEPGDPEPSASDNLLTGETHNSNRRIRRRDPRGRGSSSGPDPVLRMRYRPAPGLEPPDDGPRPPRHPQGGIEAPDDGLRGPMPRPVPPGIQQPPDDGFREPGPRPAPPGVQQPPDDGLSGPVPQPALPSTPAGPPSPAPAIAFARAMPRPRRRPLIAAASKTPASAARRQDKTATPGADALPRPSTRSSRRLRLLARARGDGREGKRVAALTQPGRGDR